jgi:hypothetical protein
VPPAADGEPSLTSVLLDLLIRTAEAHGIHEKEELGGVYDTNWPQWYARYMSRALTEAGYGLVANGEEASGKKI